MEKPKRILIVEDEAISAMLLARTLADLGCMVKPLDLEKFRELMSRF